MFCVAFYKVGAWPEGLVGVEEVLGLCIVAPFVQTHSTKLPLLSSRLLMLVIMVVTVRDSAWRSRVDGKNSVLESEILIHSL